MSLRSWPSSRAKKQCARHDIGGLDLGGQKNGWHEFSTKYGGGLPLCPGIVTALLLVLGTIATWYRYTCTICTGTFLPWISTFVLTTLGC